MGQIGNNPHKEVIFIPSEPLTIPEIAPAPPAAVPAERPTPVPA